LGGFVKKTLGDELLFIGNGDDTLPPAGTGQIADSAAKPTDPVFAPSFLDPTNNVVRASVAASNSTLVTTTQGAGHMASPGPMPNNGSANEASVVTPTGSAFGTETVTLAGSGLTFINTYDASVGTDYHTAILFAEHDLESHFTNSVTIRVNFGFANLNGFLAQNSFFNTVNATYANLKSALTSHATSADDIAAVNALTATAPSNTHSSSATTGFLVPAGMARILGLEGASTTRDDSLVLGNGFTWNFDPNNRGAAGGYDAIGAIEHEISEGGMGRVGGLGFQNNTWAPLDLFRFNSSGVRDETGGQDGVTTYFSPNGSNPDLTHPYHNSINSANQFDGDDPGDWDTIGDAFGSGAQGTVDTLSATDLRVMDVLGWNLADTTAPSLTHDSTLTVAFAGTSTITSSVLQFDDNVSTHAQETYSIVTAPAHGTLLKSGSATSSFTQADIDNGLISYHENGSVASSDSFVFKVTDAAGNLTADQQFQFQISPPPDTTAPALTHDSTLTISAGTTASITSSLLQFDDNTSMHAQETYSIVTGPAHGTLLKSGVATTSFTQADIDNGLISFHENVTGATSDSFTFNVTDAAGNTSATTLFQIAVRPEIAEDFNADGHSDVQLFSNSGTVGEWQLNGTQITGGGNAGTLDPAWHIAGTGDFNADGHGDTLLFRNSGTVGEWQLNGTQITGGGNVGTLDPSWHIAGTGDFNHDGRSDVLLNSNSGTVGEWQLNGTQITGGGNIGTIDPTWHIAGTGDFNHDGNSDVLLVNNNGTVGEWQLNGTQITGGGNIGTIDPTWHIAGTGDFNHDGNSDILLVNNNGTVGEWLLNGTQIIGGGNVGKFDSTWHIAGIGDYNGDGNSDVLLLNNNGTVGEWQLNGTQITGGGNVGAIDPTWHI
jgi:hypothetical protein